MNHLDNLIYSSKAWNILSRAYTHKKNSSTYLLYGKEGSGRWLHAIAFTALLNCEAVKNDDGIVKPCGSCRNCMNIFNLNFDALKIAVPIPPHENKLDKAIDLTLENIQIKKEEPFALLTSERTTNIPISLAREIKKNLSMRHDKGIIRVVLFYKMEQMQKSSADALLKMIEEPPKDTVIILIADKPDSLLSTIQSRSQKVMIPKLNPEHMKDYLLERYETNEQQATLVSKISEGSLGEAINLMASLEENVNGQREIFFQIYKTLFQGVKIT